MRGVRWNHAARSLFFDTAGPGRRAAAVRAAGRHAVVAVRHDCTSRRSARPSLAALEQSRHGARRRCAARRRVQRRRNRRGRTPGRPGSRIRRGRRVAPRGCSTGWRNGGGHDPALDDCRRGGRRARDVARHAATPGSRVPVVDGRTGRLRADALGARTARAWPGPVVDRDAAARRDHRRRRCSAAGRKPRCGRASPRSNG